MANKINSLAGRAINQAKRGRGRPTKAETLRKKVFSGGSDGGKAATVNAYACSFCGKGFLSEKAKFMHEKYCASKDLAAGKAETTATDSIAVEAINQASVAAVAGVAESKIPGSILALAFASTFDVIANKAGEFWRLRADEAEALAKTWGAVIDYYFPKIENKVLMVAMGQTALIFIPRILAHNANKQFGAGEPGSGAVGRDGGQRQNNVAAENPGSSS